MSHKTREELGREAAGLWASVKDKALAPKDRMAIPAQDMATRDPVSRAREMGEVALGYTDEQALVEALASADPTS